MYSEEDTVVAPITTMTCCIGQVVSTTIEYGQPMVRVLVTDPCDAQGVRMGDIVTVPQRRPKTSDAPLVLPAESNQRLRGHRFYPTPAQLRSIPDIGATEHLNVDEVTVHLHYFAPFGDWWVTEIAREGPHIGAAYGYIKFPAHQEPEWGRIWLPELEQLRVTLQGIAVIVERDLQFRPTRVRDIPQITSQQP